MAKKVMTPIEAKYNEITKLTFEKATSVSDGFELKQAQSDEYVLLIVNNKNAGAQNITVKAPGANGFYAGTDIDLVANLTAGQLAVIRVESAKYLHKDGTLHVVPGATDVEVVAIH